MADSDLNRPDTPLLPLQESERNFDSSQSVPQVKLLH